MNWLPQQPYNSTPRMTPGLRVLVRIIGADQDQHPLHLHGNHYHEIARYGRLLKTNSGALASRGMFTTLSVPGQTVDAIFTWTGAKLGWDIYGTPADGMPDHTCEDSVNNETLTGGPDGFADLSADNPWEYCADHGKRFPVVLPANQNLAFGGWWSGSPFMGQGEALPPGEGGLDPPWNVCMEDNDGVRIGTRTTPTAHSPWIAVRGASRSAGLQDLQHKAGRDAPPTEENGLRAA